MREIASAVAHSVTRKSVKNAGRGDINSRGRGEKRSLERDGGKFSDSGEFTNSFGRRGCELRSRSRRRISPKRLETPEIRLDLHISCEMSENKCTWPFRGVTTWLNGPRRLSRGKIWPAENVTTPRSIEYNRPFKMIRK